MLSARSARIRLPASILSGGALVGWNAQPARAGIGTEVPFETTLKERFRGAIRNYVVLLRLNSTLLKRGYGQNMATVAVSGQEPTDLSSAMANQFAEGTLTRGVDDLTSTGITKVPFKDDLVRKRKKALILFGPEVDIAPDGTVGQMRGGDTKGIKTAEAALIEKIKGRKLDGLDEVTLLGGIIIHRSKGGGKDAGEDCFQAFSCTTIKSNGDVVDLFGPIFADLFE